jgi:hypothetical protein
MMPASRARPAQDRQILYADAYAHVEMRDGGTLVRIVRTARAHPDIETLRSSFSGLIHALDQSGRKARKMLYDARAPVGRNDPAFEQEMARLRPGIDRGFARIYAAPSASCRCGAGSVKMGSSGRSARTSRSCCSFSTRSPE